MQTVFSWRLSGSYLSSRAFHTSISRGAFRMLVEFEVEHDDEGWYAHALGAGINTDGGTLDELVENICEAVSLYYEDDERVMAGEQITVRFTVEFQVDPAA